MTFLRPSFEGKAQRKTCHPVTRQWGRNTAPTRNGSEVETDAQAEVLVGVLEDVNQHPVRHRHAFDLCDSKNGQVVDFPRDVKAQRGRRENVLVLGIGP